MLRCIGVVMVMGALAAAGAADTQDETAAISALLEQQGSGVVEEAVHRMATLLEAQPAATAGQMRQHWLAELIARRRYADAAALARRAVVLCNTDTPMVAELLRLRVRALLGAGRAQEALADAKSLFNVAEMNQTAGAILLFAQCLNATHPDDVEVVEQFRREQTATAAQGATLMRSVRVDAAAYDEARKQFYGGQYLIRSGAFEALMGQGNLLLLADRGAEAEAIFRQALQSADEDQLLPAREGVARAIKAEDGAIGRANAWIRAL